MRRLLQTIGTRFSQTFVQPTTLEKVPLSTHRSVLALYDLQPAIGAFSYLAPNVTIAGEVTTGSYCAIWYGVVIRGDLNQVSIMNSVVIGERTVIHTATALPNGLPAMVSIGNKTVIQNDCTLYSCTIDDECFIGYKSIILEGAKLESGVVLAPHTVVPPGRLIPANQLWAGNPAQYIRDIEEKDLGQNLYVNQNNILAASMHKYEFLQQNSAYLQKENTQDDIDPEYVEASLRIEEVVKDTMPL
ncbi:hypothetical protein pb186bvf_014489 [Paramecium bursaria]